MPPWSLACILYYARIAPTPFEEPHTVFCHEAKREDEIGSVDLQRGDLGSRLEALETPWPSLATVNPKIK